MDAVLFLFSFSDRTSFDDLPNQIDKWTGKSGRNVVKLVVGTKYPFVCWTVRKTETFPRLYICPKIVTQLKTTKNWSL